MRVNTFVTSDWHLGHRLMDRLRPAGWADLILSNYRSQVDDRDTVYFLGDMVMRYGSEGRNWWETIRTLPGRKILVAGNHDKGSIAKLQALGGFESVWREWTSYEQSYPEAKGTKLLLSHVPMVITYRDDKFNGWRRRIQAEYDRGGYTANLHGHTHAHSSDDPRLVNCCVEVNEYALILMDSEER